eukprot:CAMPEP_0174255236 /NCGR_PEP_ID=MMETSP0439-20130205/4582_1 /TAXON_ID=0 /ORGANISM="Stereomyxa ramosa, Strain Chinc5" /LENGTH=408 /DNA_ID=CAMNT_0015337329 /DNA_START=61 /DNA_END=1288 /DNA_ORIENTATION=+
MSDLSDEEDDRNYQHELLEAVNSNNLIHAKFCLEKKEVVNVNTIGGGNDWTLLHLAVCKSFYKLCKLLIDYGANVNNKTLSGETPLHFAVETETPKTLDIIQLLIDSGALVNLPATHEKPITLDDESDSEEETPGDGPTPLACAVDDGFFDICKILLENGADVGTFDHTGRTPLHIACENDEYEICELLLKHGADPNFVAEADYLTYTCSPLHEAAKISFELCELLLKAGGDTKIQDSNGDTPLHFACKLGPEVIRLFLSYSDRSKAPEVELTPYGNWVLDDRVGRGSWSVNVYDPICKITNNDGKSPLDVAPYPKNKLEDMVTVSFYGGVRKLTEICSISVLQNRLSAINSAEFEKKVGIDVTNYVLEVQGIFFPNLKLTDSTFKKKAPLIKKVQEKKKAKNNNTSP